MGAGLRKDDRIPDPKRLGPIYRDKFLAYLDKNPHMKITCFGLNCAAPEDLIESLNGMFAKKKKDDMDFQKELEERQIGFCVYANLNDRRNVHISGYDRNKDDATVNLTQPNLHSLPVGVMH